MRIHKLHLILLIFSFTLFFSSCRNSLTESDELITDLVDDGSSTTDDSTDDSSTDDSSTDDSSTDDSSTDDSSTDDSSTDDSSTDDSSTNTVVATYLPGDNFADLTLNGNVDGNPNYYNVLNGSDVVCNITNNWAGNAIGVTKNSDSISVEVTEEADEGYKAQLNAYSPSKLVAGQNYRLKITIKASSDTRIKAAVVFKDNVTYNDDRVMDAEALVSTEYQELTFDFTARDITDQNANILADAVETLQINMGNGSYEEGTVDIVTTGITFLINKLSIETVE